MLVLALDTSSAAVCAALVEVDGGGSGNPLEPDGLSIRAQHTDINARGHAELLAPAIASCLAAANATPADLGAIVAGVGPGPYTGLRVGLVTAAVLGETLDVPTYGVCSLDGIAGRFGPGDPLLVAADARRREVYWARYEHGVRVTGPAVDAPADVPIDGIAAMAGAGARLYADQLRLPLRDGDYPYPPALVRVALDRIRAAAPGESLTPLYLRHPDAVVPESLR